MASAWDTNFGQTAGAAVASAFGEAVTYTGPDGTTTAIAQAVFDLASEQDEENPGGEEEVERAVFHLQTSELSSVEPMATITRDGVLWTVERAVHSRSGELSVPVVRIVTGARHKPGYRGRHR